MAYKTSNNWIFYKNMFPNPALSRHECWSDWYQPRNARNKKIKALIYEE